MKKIILSIFIICLLATVSFPFWAKAEGLVPNTCGQSGEITYSNGECTSGSTCPCGISDFFTLLGNIYSFIVLQIATPLAIIAITIGGILMLVSAGNPNLMAMGKKVLYAAIIGLVLVFGSWLIINFILTALGMPSGSWANLNI